MYLNAMLTLSAKPSTNPPCCKNSISRRQQHGWRAKSWAHAAGPRPIPGVPGAWT